MLTGPQRKWQTGNSPQKLVVLLHGYGSNGDNLIDLADMWQPSLPQVVFHSPHAIEPCEAMPFGYQWFGLKDFSPFNMRQGLDKAAPILKTYLEHLLTTYHLNSSDLVLVGFSQGTIMALEMMFYLPGLAGIIGYAGAFYPPSFKAVLGHKPDVLLVHGTADMVVPYPLMIESYTQLQRLGLSPRTYTCTGLGHSIDVEGITQGGQFLQDVFSKIDATV